MKVNHGTAEFNKLLRYTKTSDITQKNQLIRALIVLDA